MNGKPTERQVVNIKGGSHPQEPSVKRPVAPTAGEPSLELRTRISATIRAARAQRELETQQASDRAAAERQNIQRKATEALLSLLTDDVLDLIIGKHAGLGEPPVGTIKVTKHGVELVRGGSSIASHMSGERLDISFNGALLQSGQQLKSSEFLNRVHQLQVQGVKVGAVYDAPGQSILLTVDYAEVLD
jgi:hypothetical protein